VELVGRLHDDKGRAGDLSLTSEIRGLFGPARSPTALYVALIPHSPFINASGETLTTKCRNNRVSSTRHACPLTLKATRKSPSKPPAEEGFAVYGLRNSYTRTSDLMRRAMNGLYVYSIVVAGSLLALVRNPALTVTPSDNRVFLEKSFDTPQHSGQQPSQPALPYAAPESDVLDNEPPMPQMSDTLGGPGS
jgi:hypothetical protein